MIGCILLREEDPTERMVIDGQECYFLENPLGDEREAGEWHCFGGAAGRADPPLLWRERHMASSPHFHSYVSSRDVFLAVVALALVVPLMGIIYLLVTLDGGPGVVVNRRLRRDGCAVSCWMFRTTVADPLPLRAGSIQRSRLRIVPDMTATGLFLHRSGLDHLPQLFNIIRGDIDFADMAGFVAADL